MSKYVLAKDLPFAKAGLVADDGSECIYFHFDRAKRDGFYRFREDEIQQLINEGWVEEVKPREFILAIKEDTREILYNNNYTNADYYYKTYWRGEPRKLPERIKLIKVREVL